MPTKGQILSFAFNPKEQTVSLCTAHGWSYFFYYKPHQNQNIKVFRVLCNCSASAVVEKVWFASKHNRWYTADTQNKLQSWAVVRSKV
jgi:hypothetical protein